MKSKLGQNFLINQKIAEREVEYADITKNDTVLEIGPGKGVLTKILAGKAKRVLAIEIDNTLVEKLRTIIPENVEIINDDILKVDFATLPFFNKIVSNLPFQISSPVTFKILDYDFTLAVLIYQKEFADRLIAKPGSKNYSRLSVSAYYKANCEHLENIPKSCFSPMPKVDASVIRLTPKPALPFSVLDEEFFFNLVKRLFSHRRKKIRNTLKEFYSVDLTNVPFLENRAEDLTPEQLGNLSNILYRL